MKKSIALASASAMGMGMVALGGAAPALAAPVTTPCTNVTEHTVTTSGTLGDNWYMDCIPQYGLGKVEFTVTGPGGDPLPADFVPLDDPSVTSVAPNTGAAATTYFTTGGPPPPADTTAGFAIVISDTTDPAVHSGLMMVPISGVQAVSAGDMPSACSGTYDGTYRVDYSAAEVTFTEQVGGQPWNFTVNWAPQPLYLGINVLPDGSFDTTEAQCASNGVESLALSDEASAPAFAWSFLTGNLMTASLSPDPTVSETGNFQGVTLPDVAAVVPEPPAEDPELAATGLDARVPLIGGGVLLIVGTLLLSMFGRRRRRDA